MAKTGRKTCKWVPGKTKYHATTVRITKAPREWNRYCEIIPKGSNVEVYCGTISNHELSRAMGPSVHPKTPAGMKKAKEVGCMLIDMFLGKMDL